VTTSKALKIKELAKRAYEIIEKLEAIKEVYKESDQIIDEFLKLGINQVDIYGSKIVLIDNFLNQDVIFKMTSFKRYELKKKCG